MLGGFIFGVGAAINGACAYATMARLVDGEGGMLVTIVGFALGVLCFIGLLGLHWVARPVQSPALAASALTYAALIACRRADMVPLRRHSPLAYAAGGSSPLRRCPWRGNIGFRPPRW